MTTDAQKQAKIRYEKNKLDKTLLRMPKGKKAAVENHIKKTGETFNGFVNRAINETMDRDNAGS